MASTGPTRPTWRSPATYRTRCSGRPARRRSTDRRRAPPLTTSQALDARNAAWADELEAREGRRERDTPGAGAAGGVGFALLAAQDRFRSFALRPGVDLVMEATDFPARSREPTSSSPARGGSTPRPPSARPRSASRSGQSAAGVPCIAVGGGVEVDGIACAGRRSARPRCRSSSGRCRSRKSMAAGAAPLERCGERLARLVSTW